MAGSKATKRSRIVLRVETRAGIGVYRRNLGRDIRLALGTSRGASFRLGNIISVMELRRFVRENGTQGEKR